MLVKSVKETRIKGDCKRKLGPIFFFKDPVKPAATSTPEQKKKHESKVVQATVSSVSAGTQVIHIYLPGN